MDQVEVARLLPTITWQQQCVQKGHKVLTAAWTGIAATLLSCGRTVHSLFKLPVPLLDTSCCNITPTSNYAAMLREVSLFIVDETSMVPLHAFNAIDRLLRDITGIDIMFGGKVFYGEEISDKYYR